MPNLVGIAPPSSDLSGSLTFSSPMTSMPRFHCEQRGKRGVGEDDAEEIETA
jgi:hypothetical protein